MGVPLETLVVLWCVFYHRMAAYEISGQTNSVAAVLDEKMFVWLRSRAPVDDNLASLFSPITNLWDVQQRIRKSPNSPATQVKFIEMDIPGHCNSTSVVEILQQLDAVFERLPQKRVKAVIGPSCTTSANSTQEEANDVVRAVTWAVNARGASHIDWRLVAEQQHLPSGNFNNSIALPSISAVQTCAVQRFLPLLRWNEIGIIYDTNSTLCEPLAKLASIQGSVTVNAVSGISMQMNGTAFAQNVQHVLNASRIVVICAAPPAATNESTWWFMRRLFATALSRTYARDTTNEYVWIYVPPYPLSPQNEESLVEAFSFASIISKTPKLFNSHLIILSLLTKNERSTSDAAKPPSSITLMKFNETQKSAQDELNLSSDANSTKKWAPFAIYLADAILANIGDELLSQFSEFPPAPVLKLQMLATNESERSGLRVQTYGTLFCNSSINPPLRLTRRLDWHTLNKQPPLAKPVCGFNNDICQNRQQQKIRPISVVDSTEFLPDNTTTTNKPGRLSGTVLGIIIAIGVAIVIGVILVIIRYYRKAKREALLMRTDWQIGLHELRLLQLTRNGFGDNERTQSAHSVMSLMSTNTNQDGDSVNFNGLSYSRNPSLPGKSVSQSSLMYPTTNRNTTTKENNKSNTRSHGNSKSRTTDVHSIGIAAYTTGQITVELYALSSQIASELGFGSANTSQNTTAVSGARFSNDKKASQSAHKNSGSQTLPRTFILELRAMKDALHENVNLFVGICLERQPTPCFAMRYCPKGALQNLIITHDEETDDDDDEFGEFDFVTDKADSFGRGSRRSLSSSHVARSTKSAPRRSNGGLLLDENINICAGMRYLHTETSLGFHGRLRSNTILLDGRWTAKVSGFGMWRWKYDAPLESLKAEQPERLLWTSPELLRCAEFIDEVDERTFQAADVWSMGVVVSEIIYQESPYAYLKISPADIVTRMMAAKQPDERENGSRQKLGPNSGSQQVSELLPQHAVLSTVPATPNTAIHDFGSTATVAVEAVHDNSGTASAASSIDTLEALRRLMIQCWHENANLRPTFVTLARSLRAITRGRPINIVDAMIAKMESYTNNLEALVTARTADLREQQARADQLLSRMMPNAVAERLKAGLTVEPEYFNASTVFFSDIVKFTVLASRSTPFQVVHLLNSVYVFMDNVMAKYSVYKVETIGDAYMVVSGVPERIERHAAEICSMALEIRDGLATNVSIAHLPPPPPDSEEEAQNFTLRIRIGINSGPTVAGVVGLAMPRYCLFGDTVNVASRMESHGLPDKIQLSPTSWSELTNSNTSVADQRELYVMSARGLVDVKGKGEMTTYWLMSGPTRADEVNDNGEQETMKKSEDEENAGSKLKFAHVAEDSGVSTSEQPLEGYDENCVNVNI